MTFKPTFTTVLIFNEKFKKYWGASPEHGGVGSSSFEPLVWAIFSYTWGWVMLFFFFKQDWHTFDPIDKRGNSF